MFDRKIITNSLSAAAALLAVGIASPAFAAGTHDGGHDHGHGNSAIGEPGKPGEVTRTVEVTMGDIYFEPESVEVEPGETIRFVVTNAGAFVHEFNIGTPEMHAAHQEEMTMMMEHGVLEVDKIHRDKMNMEMGDGHTMAHDDPNSVLLETGETAEIIWTFPSAMELEFACNVPGHYESGMAGEFLFWTQQSSR